MEISEGDEYEALGSGYQYSLTELLDETLRKHDIGREQRERICGEFVFELSMLYDQGEMFVDGVEYEPTVAFRSENGLHLRSKLFQYHEYAFGVVGEYFEDGDKRELQPSS